MFKKLFNNKKFIFAFAFILEFVFYYFFEYLLYGGEFLLPDIGLGPILGLMFGPVGALGQALASLTFQILDGCDVVASFIDFSIMLFISILAYKLWYLTFNGKGIDTPKFDSTYNLLKFIAIIGMASLIYWGLINIFLGLYPNFSEIYPLSSPINRISYAANMFNFSIVFALILINVFNIEKIPLQYPKKWSGLVNIRNYYFLAAFIVIMIYLLPVKLLNMDTYIMDWIFLIITIVTSVLFCLNRLEIEITPQIRNYSLIEKIILFFMMILAITLIILLDMFREYFQAMMPDLNMAYISIISLNFASVLIILLCILHIHYIEKNITNPIYDLIDSITQYGKSKKANDEKGFNADFGQYLKNDDDITRLIRSFVGLNRNISTNLCKIEKTAAEKEKIETELNVASNIQLGMIKTDFEEFSAARPFEIRGFLKPAREVGGDFYDFFDIDEEHIGFVIGDVSGKGVPATLFMIKTMQLIENHSKFDSGVEEIFTNVNNLSCIRNSEELFVTSWFGKLNLESGRLSFVNAGHTPPLIRQNGSEFEFMDVEPNFVLGSVEDLAYESQTICLNPGDTIFLYSDGITEANDNYNGFYGETRLRKILNEHKDESLEDIIKKVENDIGIFCGRDNQFDDMTMLMIKYTGGEEDE